MPQTGDENIRLNLWLINGNPPTDNQEVEVIIKSFQFVPLGSPLPATLTRPRLQNGQFHFDLVTQRDRRYQVQVSTNLFSWQNLGQFLATNNVMSFTGTNSTTTSPLFYRAVTLP